MCSPFIEHNLVNRRWPMWGHHPAVSALAMPRHVSTPDTLGLRCPRYALVMAEISSLSARVQAGSSPVKKQRKVIVLDDSDGNSTGSGSAERNSPSRDRSSPSSGDSAGRNVPGNTPGNSKKKEVDRLLVTRRVAGMNEFLVKFKGGQQLWAAVHALWWSGTSSQGTASVHATCASRGRCRRHRLFHA